MSVALKFIPISDTVEKLSEKPRLGKKLCKPVLVWENSKLSHGMHREKSRAKLRSALEGSIYGASNAYSEGNNVAVGLQLLPEVVGQAFLGFGNSCTKKKTKKKESYRYTD